MTQGTAETGTGISVLISGILEQLQNQGSNLQKAESNEDPVSTNDTDIAVEEVLLKEESDEDFSFNAEAMIEGMGESSESNKENTQEKEDSKKEETKPFTFVASPKEVEKEETKTRQSKSEGKKSFTISMLEDGSYETVKEDFSIMDDACADWAIRCLKSEYEEYERLKTIADEQMVFIKEKLAEAEKRYNNKTKYLKSKLQEYFNGVPEKRETKTKQSYRLLSGSLVLKKGGQEFKKDDEALVQYLKENKQENLVQLKETVKWAEFKKKLSVKEDGSVIDKSTGEVVECVNVVLKPDQFEIEFK